MGSVGSVGPVKSASLLLTQISRAKGLFGLSGRFGLSGLFGQTARKLGSQKDKRLKDKGQRLKDKGSACGC